MTTDVYDPLDRLTDIVASSGTIHYGYDAVGNRTVMTDPTGSTGYTYDAGDELTAATGPSGTTSYGYDANGNQTSAGPWTYTFNLANQLAAASGAAEGGPEVGVEPTPQVKITPKIARQMGPRGWTSDAIERAMSEGQQVKAINKANGNPATRYIDPVTGQSVVVDDFTGTVIQVGGPGFVHGPQTGDSP